MDTVKANILYVDDEVNNLTTFKAAFRREYNVFACTSPKEAVEVLEKNDIDLIITDQRMPGKTGVEFLEEIIPDYPNIIRMILTGFSDIDDIIKAINSGHVFRYITKPWDERELKQNIDIGIKLRRIEGKNRELLINLKEEFVKQQRILELFQKYVPENIINESLKKENTKALFEGEICSLTVLFVDIRNFTAFSAQVNPKQVVNYLNDFFTVMTECIKKHQGSIDKFIGDSILAIFGAPIADFNNQQNAVLAALDMIDALKKFNEEHEQELNFKAIVGIGINSGEAVIGNIGTESRIEYTAIGDTINVASRIEKLTKDKPNTIIISESTYKAVQNDFIIEPLGPHIIRGKNEKINLYKVIGRSKSKT